MSMTMRERIAAAMAREPWGTLSDTLKEVYLRQTDLAFAELETPTDEMTKALGARLCDKWRPSGLVSDDLSEIFAAAIHAAREGK